MKTTTVWAASLAAAVATLLPARSTASPVYSPKEAVELQRRQGVTSNNATWSWTSGPKMNGVALGNWLVLERWMDEATFVQSCGNASAIDEWTWSESLGANAASVLQDHWNTWITDDDIRRIAEGGFNTIRIPLGYWAFIDEPAGTPYVSMGGQQEQLTRVLASAQNYGLYAVLDMHGLPGSQNGEQESGHVGYNNFYQADNQNYSDATIDAVISYIEASPYRSIITALAACNEPIYYSEDQFDTLVAYYERTYAKLSTMTPPMPMMFHPGHPEVSPMALFQGFIDGKDPELLIYEDHPYPGRLQPKTSYANLISQVCQKAASYASYGVPVGVTEWAISTEFGSVPDWDMTFYTAQARAWAQSAGGIFWSYKTLAYPDQFNQTENYTLYSWVDLANDGLIPLPAAGQDSQAFLFSLNDTCGFSNDTSTDTFGTIVSSVMPTVTSAFTKRSVPEPTAA